MITNATAAAKTVPSTNRRPSLAVNTNDATNPRMTIATSASGVVAKPLMLRRTWSPGIARWTRTPATIAMAVSGKRIGRRMSPSVVPSKYRERPLDRSETWEYS